MRSEKLVVAATRDGFSAYIDTEEKKEKIEDLYLLRPFQAEYSFQRDGGEIFGDTYGFAPISFLQKKNTCAYRFLSVDKAAEITVKQKFYGGVMSQITQIKNLSGGKLCVKQLYNLCNGLARECLDGDFRTDAELGVIRGEWGGEG